MNVALVSHCDFTGNSALHVHSIACELQRRGISPVIVVPGNLKSVRDLGTPPFPVQTYRDVRKRRLRFPNGLGADFVHSFTPRDAVAAITVDLVNQYRCPYVVHLEDNEEAILGRRPDPNRANSLVAGAAGLTVVVDRLIELTPTDVPVGRGVAGLR